MNDILEKINSARHVEIVTEQDDLLVASALYTYVLTLHKKVSIVCREKNIDMKFSFMPWFEKIKSTDTPSADYTVKLSYSAVELYDYFKILNKKINKKMATALYGAIVNETEGFTNSKVNGTMFAVSGELLHLGAEYQECNRFITQNSTLGLFRLKAIMFANMQLINSAKVALFIIRDDDFKATTTDENDAKKIMKEALYLPYVDSVVLLHVEKDSEVIRIMNKEI